MNKKVTLYECKKAPFGRIKLSKAGTGILISTEGSMGQVKVDGAFTRWIGTRESVGNLVYR